MASWLTVDRPTAPAHWQVHHSTITPSAGDLNMIAILEEHAARQNTDEYDCTRGDKQRARYL